MTTPEEYLLKRPTAIVAGCSLEFYAFPEKCNRHWQAKWVRKQGMRYIRYLDCEWLLTQKQYREYKEAVNASKETPTQ